MKTSIESLSSARRTRLHRISAAQFLASLESSCTLEELAEIDWHALQTVPHWCLGERAESNRLQLVCGTVFLAPQIVEWLDGHRLKQARGLVGPQYFDAALRAGSSRVSGETCNSSVSVSVPELLASAGAAVLIGAIEHSVVQKLLAKQFPMEVAEVDKSIAQPVYQLALEVIDQFVVVDSPSENHSAAESEAGSPQTVAEQAAEVLT